MTQGYYSYGDFMPIEFSVMARCECGWSHSEGIAAIAAADAAVRAALDEHARANAGHAPTITVARTEAIVPYPRETVIPRGDFSASPVPIELSTVAELVDDIYGA